MSKEIEVEGGGKEIVYTADEYKAKETELQKTQSDLETAKRISAEKGNNFKKFSEMNDEEKKVLDANQINLLKNEERLISDIEGLKTKLTEKEQKENQSSKNSALLSIHHGEESSKKILEEKYNLLTGMPETTSQEIAARAKEAAKLAGIVVDPRNPLFTHISGDAPNYKPKSEYVDTPEGKTAADMVRSALGIKTDKK